MAASVEFEDDNGRVVCYVRHANGGGLVSPRAGVHEGAMVASTGYVEAGGQVGDRSRIDAGNTLCYTTSRPRHSRRHPKRSDPYTGLSLASSLTPERKAGLGAAGGSSA